MVAIIMAIGIICPFPGICDGDAANDLTLKDGSVVGEAQDPAPFLDSWQVPSSLTSVGQTRFRPDSCATADCSPCLRMVSNRTFSACHRFVCTTGSSMGEPPRLGTAAPTCRGQLPKGVELGTRLEVFRSSLLPLGRAGGNWALGCGESG